LLLEPRNTSMRVRLPPPSSLGCASPCATALICFSGYSIQLNRQNYLVAINAFQQAAVDKFTGAWRVQIYRLSYGYAIRLAVKNPISDGFELGG